MSGRRSRSARLSGSWLVVLMLLLSLTSCGWLGLGGDDVPTGITAPEESKLDLAYAGQSPAQKLDLLLPKRTGDAIPLVIAIHGGGWQVGDKRDIEFLVDPLRTQGYAVASLNYRMSGEAQFPAAVLDAKAAVRWLRAHAADYGLDPGRFATWGFSAGGNLAALIGVTSGSTDAGMPTFNDHDLGNPDASSAVQAVVDFYGPSDLLKMDQQFAEDGHCAGVPERHNVIGSSESLYLGGTPPDVPELAKDASPVSYVDAAKNLPPFHLAHGRDDCVVPDRQSIELATSLKAKGGRAELTIVPGFGHADPAFDRQQAPAAIMFLNSVFGRDGQNG